MISRALNALGFGRKPVEAPQPEATDQRLRQMTASRDDWKELAGKLQTKLDEANAKFKLAATDLAKQAEEIAAIRDDTDAWERTANALDKEVSALRPDAQKWRNSLKRSRDRKKVTK